MVEDLRDQWTQLRADIEAWRSAAMQSASRGAACSGVAGQSEMGVMISRLVLAAALFLSASAGEVRPVDRFKL